MNEMAIESLDVSGSRIGFDFIWLREE